MLTPKVHLNLPLQGAPRLGPGVWFLPTPHPPPLCEPHHRLPRQPPRWLTIGCYKTLCCPGYSDPSLTPKIARRDATITSTCGSAMILRRRGCWRVVILSSFHLCCNTEIPCCRCRQSAGMLPLLLPLIAQGPYVVGVADMRK